MNNRDSSSFLIVIECAFVAVHANRVDGVLAKVDNQKLKTRKVRVKRV